MEGRRGVGLRLRVLEHLVTWLVTTGCLVTSPVTKSGARNRSCNQVTRPSPITSHVTSLILLQSVHACLRQLRRGAISCRCNIVAAYYMQHLEAAFAYPCATPAALLCPHNSQRPLLCPEPPLPCPEPPASRPALVISLPRREAASALCRLLHALPTQRPLLCPEPPLPCPEPPASRPVVAAPPVDGGRRAFTASPHGLSSRPHLTTSPHGACSTC